MQSQESVNVKVNKPSQSIAKYVKLVSQSNKRTGKEYLCRLKQFEEYCISVHNFRLDDLFISKSKTVKVDIYELLGGFVSYLVDKNCYSNLTIKYRVITARTLLYLRQQAQQKLKTHIEKTMPEEYQKGMVAIDQVLRITWGIVIKSADVRVRLQALAMIVKCNSH